MNFRGQGQSIKSERSDKGLGWETLRALDRDSWVHWFHTHQSKSLTRYQLPHCIAATPKWLFYQPRQRLLKTSLERKKPSNGRVITRMWTFQPHLPQENWWKYVSPWRKAKPQDQMIFTQSSFYMQEILQTSGCVSICLPLWKDVKSPQSGARQLSALPSLTSPRTTLRDTGLHC